MEKLRADLQFEHCQDLQDLELDFREKEKEKQLQVGWNLCGFPQGKLDSLLFAKRETEAPLSV